MSSFIITGKLGCGKGLVSVAKAYDYLQQGRRVASNLDLFFSGYFAPQSKRTYMRLPDKPTLFDLQAIGLGSDKVAYDENGAPLFSEDDHGLLVLDELGSWFNARTWQDKSRQPVLDFLIHLRKLGWDCLLIVQDIDSIDKQLRGMLAEHLVVCRRLDRIKIPYIGGVLRQFGLKGNLPKVHRAKVHYGETAADMVVDTWTYTGTRYYRTYNTLQKFTDNYPHGVHSVLSPWHLKGRYAPSKLSMRELAEAAWENYLDAAQPPRPVQRAPEHPLIAKLAKLPCPEQRMEFYRRFEAVGAFLNPLEKLSAASRRELCGLC